MDKPRSATIGYPYIGGVLSVNRYKYHGTHVTRTEVKDWMQGLGWMIKAYHIEGWKLPIKIKVGGVFKDKRSCPDIHNLLKPICDSIEEVTGINDRGYETETSEPIIDKWCDEPMLFITVAEGGNQ